MRQAAYEDIDFKALTSKPEVDTAIVDVTNLDDGTLLESYVSTGPTSVRLAHMETIALQHALRMECNVNAKDDYGLSITIRFHDPLQP